MKRTVLTWILCFCLLVGLLSGVGLPAEAAEAELTADAVITFTADGALVDGAGVEIDDDGEVDIRTGGVYRIVGASDNGRIVAELEESEEITLILAGCDLVCADDEVIYIKSAASAAVILEDGTENTLTSGVEPVETAAAEASDAEAAAEEEDASGAALRAKSALTISGGGALTVYGYVNNGIASVGDLTVEDGRIEITSVNDALKSRGLLTVSGGEIVIRSQADGVQADGGLTVLGGGISVVTGGGAEAASAASGEFRMERSPWDADDSENSVSRKGLKSEGDIIVSGGQIELDAEDDAIHAAGNIELLGGEISAASGDDGVHADGQFTVSDGSVTVTRSYEGLEGKAVVILGGTVDVTSSDDGVNVNGGDFGWGRRASEEPETTEDDGVTPVLRIAGGTVLVNASGDGLDSNSDLLIEGGTILVSGPTDNFNSALDYGDGGCDFFITGGTVMAAGSSGMAESPAVTEGSQPSILYVRQDGSCAAGDTVTLTDADGNVLLSSSFAKSFNCVVLSSPDMAVGQTYTLVMGDHETTITLSSTTYSNRSGGFGFGR